MFAVYVLSLIALANGLVSTDLMATDRDYYAEVRASRDFTGKVVLVTGSSSGIGEQIVKLFSALGANVVVTGLKDTDIQRVVKEAQALSPKGLKALGLVADLTKMDQLTSLLVETVKTFGRLDVLVNNAGLYLLGDVADPRYLDIFDAFEKVDTRAALQLIQSAVQYLEKTSGTVINVSSVLTKHPGAVQSHPLNQTDPIAVARYNKSVSHTPLGRIGVPMDLAKGVAFLASTDAEFITGQNVVIDGGLSYNLDSTFMITTK